MKTFLSIAAALGLTISAASAECPGHSKVQADDRERRKGRHVEFDR